MLYDRLQIFLVLFKWHMLSEVWQNRIIGTKENCLGQSVYAQIILQRVQGWGLP